MESYNRIQHTESPWTFEDMDLVIQERRRATDINKSKWADITINNGETIKNTISIQVIPTIREAQENQTNLQDIPFIKVIPCLQIIK
ncbi:10179_t:CDS:2 [Diversispora eburnea]|uniref:10179_t:CDS:1 n=1 Tax=Diversispora eburnea TaxID=1213867 RepID=A0A9N9A2N6_9GLOM|nr:10179_t:CDS:2 [Diversispora eburnea]